VLLLEEGTDILYEDESEEESEEEYEENTIILEDGCAIADAPSDSEDDGAGGRTAALRRVRFEALDEFENVEREIAQQSAHKK